MIGKLIAIDGVDGCGKSSQAKLLADYLRNRYPNLNVVLTKEPWDVQDNIIGQKIRTIMVGGENKCIWADEDRLDHESLQYLFFLDRCVHYTKLIIPELEKGSLVITDRERMVTYAYGMSAGVDIKTIRNWHKGIYDPDIYYFLEVNSETAISRIQNRNNILNQKYEIFEEKDRIIKNINSFKDISSKKIIKNLVELNGNQSISNVTGDLCNDVENRLSDWLRQF